MGGHWISYSTSDGPGNLYRGNGCMVSIVLDDSARNDFSAIRLLLVYKASKLLHNVTITDCPKPHLNSGDSDSIYTQGAGPLRSFRTLLSVKTSKAQHGQSISSKHHPLPICTVVLELVEGPEEQRSLVPGFTFGGQYQGEHGSVLITLVPRLDVFKESALHVAYDFTKYCDHADPSMLVFLESTHRLGSVAQGLSFFRPSAVDAHYIRILPSVSRQYSAPPLSARIIRCIVNLAVGDKKKAWRRELLSYGLVCKTWTHVLDLFFERIDGEGDSDRVDARIVARCIEGKPKRASLITSFSVSDYQRGKDRVEEWKALLTILRHAPSIREVDLHTMPQTVAPTLASLLSTLRYVHTFNLLEVGYDQEMHVLGMADILTMIAGWENLYKVDIREWAPTSIRRIASPLPPAKCNIYNLKLRSGIISGTQLMQFALTPTPRLKMLRLQHLEGLTNSDLYGFFSVTGPILTHLIISCCTILRSSANEELAIDALMPRMTNLEMLSVDGDLVSAQAIAGRSTWAKPPPAFFRGLGFDINGARPEMTMKDVREAFEVTGWERVNIHWWEAPEDAAALRETAKAAKARGIVTNLRC